MRALSRLREYTGVCVATQTAVEIDEKCTMLHARALRLRIWPHFDPEYGPATMPVYIVTATYSTTGIASGNTESTYVMLLVHADNCTRCDLFVNEYCNPPVCLPASLYKTAPDAGCVANDMLNLRSLLTLMACPALTEGALPVGLEATGAMPLAIVCAVRIALRAKCNDDTQLHVSRALRVCESVICSRLSKNALRNGNPAVGMRLDAVIDRAVRAAQHKLGTSSANANVSSFASAGADIATYLFDVPTARPCTAHTHDQASASGRTSRSQLAGVAHWSSVHDSRQLLLQLFDDIELMIDTSPTVDDICPTAGTRMQQQTSSPNAANEASTTMTALIVAGVANIATLLGLRCQAFRAGSSIACTGACGGTEIPRWQAAISGHGLCSQCARRNDTQQL